MYIQFKKLRVKTKDEIANYDNYYIVGIVCDYDTKILDCLSKDVVKSNIDNKLKVQYHITKDPSVYSRDNEWFNANDVLEYEFMSDEEYDDSYIRIKNALDDFDTFYKNNKDKPFNEVFGDFQKLLNNKSEQYRIPAEVLFANWMKKNAESKEK